MYKSPQVTVITPVFNGEKYIRECIESVRMQNGISVEHILIDDGSTDATPLIIKEYKDVIYFRQEKKGANVARNLGINKAKSKYVKFLDADDLLCAECLKEQLENSYKLNKFEISYGCFQAFKDDENNFSVGLRSRKEMEPNDDPVVDAILRDFYTSTPLYPIESLQLVKGFDERMHCRQEWNLNLKLVCAGYRFKYDNVLTFMYRQHTNEGRITTRKFILEKELRNLEYAYEVVSTIQTKQIIDAWACVLWRIGRRLIIKNEDIVSARYFFSEAKKMSKSGFKKHLNLKYKITLFVLGPIWSDLLFIKLKNIFKITNK